MITPYSNIISVTTLGANLLLDTYTGASAAYSLRKLRSGYTGDAIEVRRASDNTTQDIGFVDGELDTTSLTSFCSGTDGFVTTWYDQSGNGNDATQTTASEQPQIVSSGSVILDNGKPTISHTSVNQLLLSTTVNLFTSYALYGIAKFNANDKELFGDSGTGFGFSYGIYQNATQLFHSAGSSFTGNIGAGYGLNFNLLTIERAGTTSVSIYKNANFLNSGTLNANGNFYLSSLSGERGQPYIFSGNLSEAIFYPSDQSTNRTGISTNINDFYSIYYVAVNSEYQDILDYADSQGYQRPSYAQCALQDALVGDLKDAGVWSKLDIFYVFATDGDSDFASINWKDPNNFEITEVNSPTHTTNVGFGSNGTSSYLDTNFNTSTDGVNYTQNDAGSIFASSQIVSTTGRPYGVSSINNFLSYGFDNNRMWTNGSGRINVLNFGTSVNNQIIFSNRIDSLSVNGRITDLANGLTNTNSSTSVTSVALENGNLRVLNNNSSLWALGNIASLFGLGSNLSTAEMEDVETAYYTNYFTNL
jgi:hypothetical protein